MNHSETGYGMWTLVALNSAVFILFAFSFFKPATARDWRTFGAFSAFIVALFVEMYGFPLTIYLLSGWLATRFPGLDLLTHDSGHLWSTLLGETGDPHFGVLHLASYGFSGVRLLPAVERVASAVPRSATAFAGDHRAICPRPASAVRGIRVDLAGLLAAVAHVADLADVSCLAFDVRAARSDRGKRNAQAVRCDL